MMHNSIVYSTSENPLNSISAHDDRATILTFKQSEKMQIQARYPGREVYTIHEAEGITRASVILIRLGKDECPLYTSCIADDQSKKLNAWQLVAISRHTERFVYIPVKRDDLIRIFEDSKKNSGKVTIDTMNGTNTFINHTGHNHFKQRKPLPSYYAYRIKQRGLLCHMERLTIITRKHNYNLR